MIQIKDGLSLDESEIQEEFILASGPGGQNVNKVATAVRLRFDVQGSTSLPQALKERLKRLAGKRLTSEGVLVIEARRRRTQEANRQAALEKLVQLLRRAAEPPKPRHKTKPTRASIERRLAAKRKRAQVKQLRNAAPPDD